MKLLRLPVIHPVEQLDKMFLKRIDIGAVGLQFQKRFIERLAWFELL
jgi:hypothetical protein